MPAEPPASQDETRITWWGHATTTVEDTGLRVLFDPLLTPRLAHLSRRAGRPPGGDALAADVVAVSHAHADHLHLPSLRLLRPGTRLVVPRGTAALVQRLPVDVVEVVPGDVVELGPQARLRVVPAVHDDRRYPGSKVRAGPVGFVLEGAHSTYFPGDTELFADLSDAVGPVDVALVPVGGWGPTLGRGHMGPGEGAQVVEWLQPRLAIPVHWGTLWPSGLRGWHDELFDQPGPAFVDAVSAQNSQTEVRVLDHAETTVLR